MSQSIIVAIEEGREPASGYFANAARKAWDVMSSTAGIISRHPSGQPKTPDDIAAGLREYCRGAGAIMTLDTTAHLLISGLDQYTGTDQESYLRVPITGVSTPTADPPTVAEKNLMLSMKMFATAQASRRVALLNVFISWTEFKSGLVELYKQINSRPPKKNEASDWLKLYLRGRPELLYALAEHASLTDRLPQRPPPPQHLPLLTPFTPSISSHGDINPDWPSISLAAERRVDEVIQDVVKNMTDLARKGSHYAFLMALLPGVIAVPPTFLPLEIETIPARNLHIITTELTKVRGRITDFPAADANALLRINKALSNSNFYDSVKRHSSAK
ncbi:uncharacterized protein EV422DRAFT_572195 [Fimicolochytrium jonesii]|uniref:uncharacterized protein n=1 Tax=Fimicolochytrium jonesii TaxID=1396493 RepID=UPI0022FE2EBF|nr:uncharacterized protein EV422DRAFT_572195 [Fimicolochytrium jonesii]KAI8815995.1 hypothetical protein EV422DRAFT_572195 [Fimicolochytrium jonesii]